MAERRLVAVLGQVQTYVFQLEMLKRCDPAVARELAPRVKLNALMCRYLARRLPLEAQMTPLTCALRLALAYARAEGDRVLGALAAAGDDAEAYFERTMGGACRFHARVALDTYGGRVETELQFLHDAENLLKQLNYCHLITPHAVDLSAVDEFLARTIGGGLVVPPELYDPAQPCAVCFEELCVTANQGEATHRRLLGCVCDHLTRQLAVRVDPEDVAKNLPHVRGLDEARRGRALAALAAVDAAEAREAEAAAAGAEAGDAGETARRRADALLDAHDVFRPASRRLYAVSELQFWLASTNQAVRALDLFTHNLDDLERRERRAAVRAAAVELALFGRRPEHFDRARAARELDIIDGLLVGGCAASPDERLEALIRACYDHHMSTPMLRMLDPDRANRDALERLLEGGDDADPEGGAAGGADAGGGAGGGGGEDGPGAPPPADAVAWADLPAAALRDAERRRRLYADRLSRRSAASLAQCVREQRRELEKTLRVNVYGDALLHTYVAVAAGFRARRAFCEAVARAGTVVDERETGCFDAHSFMKATVQRHPVDAALLPALTHKFFELVNGPLFAHDTHAFAQPPNTALYFAVENVGLLPHLKEELARFMVARDWCVSEFRGFYRFQTSGVTATQRQAWRYIRELVLAVAVFRSVFHCGDVEVLRADRFAGRDGLYLTYEASCPLVAVFGAGPAGIGPGTTAVLASDVFGLLHTTLQLRGAPSR